MRVPGDRELAALSRRVGRRLRASGLRIATAESCTGGLLAKVLTDIAGSSDYLDRGWVTYSNAAKQKELGVRTRLLRRHGAVSEPVVTAMAAGAIRSSKAGVAIAVTGIAGPGGAVAGKPVGTVWIAWARRRRGRISVIAGRFQFPGGRDAVRRQSVAAALQGFLSS